MQQQVEEIAAKKSPSPPAVVREPTPPMKTELSQDEAVKAKVAASNNALSTNNEQKPQKVNGVVEKEVRVDCLTCAPTGFYKISFVCPPGGL